MLVKAQNISSGGGPVFSLRCPACAQIGTFESLQNISDLKVHEHWLCQRRCPNRKCDGHIFVVSNDKGDVLRTYPALRIDFDSTNVPPKIVEPLKQAITCYAEECHVAAAIMVRRCLEELCADRGASGKDLKERLGALRAKVVLPAELFAAMDDLRLLGNDAAHVEAKVYSSIGPEEISVAIELTKEILKGVYQLDSLVKRLQALKSKP